MPIFLLFASIDIIYTAGIGGEFLGCGCPGEEGGIARIVHYIKNTPHHLLLDLGGIFGKNRFVDSLALCHLNEYNFDGIAVSPDELRFGPEFISQMAKLSPLLCSNIFYNGNPITSRYLLKEIGKKKILITATIERGYVVESEGIQVLDPKEAIGQIKLLEELKDYDLHINITNGKRRQLLIEGIGKIDANWMRRIGLLRIKEKTYENTVTFLDSTIPEDQETKKKIEMVLNYLRNLPAQSIITEFPARVSLIYYYNNDNDTVYKYILPKFIKSYSGPLGIGYVKAQEGKKGLKMGGEMIATEPLDSFPQKLHNRIIEYLNKGGDDKIQLVYFASPNCPECHRYDVLLKAFAKEHPKIGFAQSDDEILLERFYEVYKVPIERRKKPCVFIGSRYLSIEDISSQNLYLEGEIPWAVIYGFCSNPPNETD